MTPSTKNHTDPRMGWIERLGTIGMKPAFHLIYLVFLFFPWLFNTPRTIDVVVAVLAVAIFIPIHFYAYSASSTHRIIPIALVSLLSVFCAFYITGNGVFFVYCAAMAGFHRPVWRSGIILALCTIAYGVAMYTAGRSVTEMGFMLFMALIIWMSTLSNAQTIIDGQQLEREHELDRQQSSLTERERIARDLHDLLGHTLTLVALKSDLAHRLIDTNPDQAKAEVKEIQQGARRALADVRAALNDLTVVSVLSELDNARKALSAGGIKLNITGTVPALSRDQDRACGLMIREAATNIIRHTDASKAHIKFISYENTHEISIMDNGGGQAITEGRGLSGLRNRIEALGGSVNIDHDAGIRLNATFPANLIAT